MPYSTMAEAKGIVEMYRDKPEESQAFGLRLWEKVTKNHGPKQFWGRIFEKAKLNGHSQG